MRTKHAIVCTKGIHVGNIMEFELNEVPRKIAGVILSVEDGKLFYQQEDKEKEKVSYDFPLINTPYGTFMLLKTELKGYMPDYNGWKKFTGTKSIIKKPVKKEVIERIGNALTEFQKRAINNIAGSIEDYVCTYAEDPIKLIQSQNRFMSEFWTELPVRFLSGGREIPEDEQDVDMTIAVEQKPQTYRFEELIRLNALIEREILNKNYNKPHTEENTEELKSTEYLAEGDYSPASESKIGQTHYDDARGNLVIHKTSHTILEMLAEAKIIGSKPKPDKIKTALQVYNLFQEKYSDKKAFKGRDACTKSLAGFAENGGVCIDKAITLQLALQEAGVKSRFVRGRIGGRHAWVEADVLEEGKYALILDPHKLEGTVFTKNNALAKRWYKYEDYDGTKLEYFNTIWRSK